MQKKNDSYSILSILTMYFLMEYGYVKLLFDNFFVDSLQYLLLAIVLIIRIYKFTKSMEIRLDKISGMMLLFSIWILITKLYSISTIYSDSKIINYCISVVFFFLARNVIEDIRSENFIGELLVFITKCNVLLIGLFTFINFSDFIGAATQGQRIGSESTNPIWVARLCCETILCMIVLPKDMKNKRLCFFATIGLLSLVFLTGSKGPLVALGLAWLYYIYISSQHRVGRINLKFLAQISAFMILIILGAIGIDYFKDFDFIKYRFSWESIFVDAEGYRMERYSFAWNKIQEEIITGYGFGSWSILYNGIDQMDYPHNIILELWLETGLIGLFLFSSIIIIALKGILRSSNEIKIISTFFVMSILMAMFSGSLSEGNRGLYTYLGIISSMVFISKKRMSSR